MKLAVLMSVYKNDNLLHLKESINSLLNQTYKDFDIHIQLDGFIPKDCEDFLDSISGKNTFIYKRSENKGLAQSLNDLLERVQKLNYLFYARMDADDICFSDRFEKQISYLQNNNLDIVGGQIIEFGENIDEVISERIMPTSHEEMTRLMKIRSPFSHPTIILRKEVIDKIKGYNASIFPEDYDFFVRAYMAGCKFGNVPDKVLWFRLGKDSSAAIKRRWGIKYAKNEFRLYLHFYRMGYYSLKDFLKAVLTKIPLRIMPFFIFKFIYFNVVRK